MEMLFVAVNSKANLDKINVRKYAVSKSQEEERLNESLNRLPLEIVNAFKHFILR